MTELELIIDFHKSAERQGPGSKEETLKALKLTGLSQTSGLKIADIGCGAGSQTLTLAENISGNIIAVDLFDEFLDELNARAISSGVQDRIRTLNCSMEDLPFEAELDIIWSEGAIYNMGFRSGVNKWKDHLKPGGILAVSEAIWLTSSRPEDIDEFWNREYPEIDTNSEKIRVLEESGYSVEGNFVVSESSWIDNYYIPMEHRFADFLEKHQNSELASKIVEEHKAEIELYHKYKAYYSYGFYIAKKL